MRLGEYGAALLALAMTAVVFLYRSAAGADVALRPGMKISRSALGWGHGA